MQPTIVFNSLFVFIPTLQLVTSDLLNPETYTIDKRSWQFFEHCDEYLCGAIISKCIFSKKCACNIENDTNSVSNSCYKNCEKCLGSKLETCCECLGDGFCKQFPEKQNENENSELIQFDLSTRKDPYLFKLLFENQALDVERRDTEDSGRPSDIQSKNKERLLFDAKIETFSTDLELENMPIIEEIDDEADKTDIHKDNVPSTKYTSTCTIAHVPCINNQNRCENLCFLIGSLSARYFSKVNCCQCIGPNCLGYGSIYNKCPEKNECDNKIFENTGSQVMNELTDFEYDGEGKESNQELENAAAFEEIVGDFKRRTEELDENGDVVTEVDMEFL